MKRKKAESLTVPELYERLFAAWGPQHWWPGKTPFEVIVGALLTQNTAWTNVEKAIDALREDDALMPEAIAAMPQEELAARIRPAGYYHVKARYLHDLTVWFLDRTGGDIHLLQREETASLRSDLLHVRGIGKETADSILLYAAGKPVFVIDAYTRRIAARLSLLPQGADYDTAQRFFEERLPQEVPVYNEMHALLVRLAKEHCRAHPLCCGCPLQERCPSARQADNQQQPCKRSKHP